MIDLTVHEEQLSRTVQRARERGIIVPTFAEMRDPSRIPARIVEQLKSVGLWDLHPLNLFRITWKNEPVRHGGGFGTVNTLEFPSELTGVRARIIALVGKWFPTGAHKVGATFGCLVPRLVTGQFDPTFHKAVWPSTGNFCRGGAYDSNLLACESIAILPEEMSRERFEWLSKIAGEVIATPGCESNVWEIFQKCIELQRTRDNVMIFNQFDEPGNHLWHYDVTGHAMAEVLASLPDDLRYAGVVLTSGSAGTMGCGDYLKELHPGSRLVVSEALQCPTLLLNGFGGHRIEGIGDKHVPWIHNLKNTDMIVGVDDEHTVRLFRLFNEPEGAKYLKEKGVDASFLERKDWLGLSSICNLITAIKMARYYEMTGEDFVVTVFTDSAGMYISRLDELNRERGAYTRDNAVADWELLHQLTTNGLLELRYEDRKRIHNLKYYTWVEQQGKTYEEINRQWYDRDYWESVYRLKPELDRLIGEFNARIRKYRDGRSRS